MPVSANQWRATLSETLYSMGFKPSRGDGDVWMKRNGDHYDYIGTHTDDLLIVGLDPRNIMDQLSKRYEMTSVGPPEFHLGCDYKQLDDGRWLQGTKTHCKEGIKKVEEILGRDTLGTESTPMVENLKPELDTSELLTPDGHRKYQQLVGIAQWLITCGRMDLAYAINSLSRFSAAPRKGHLDALTRVFKYLKKFPEKWICLDATRHAPSGELTNPDKDDLQVNWNEYYPDIQAEELDYGAPEILQSKSLDTLIYFDSNHAHDEVTRRSVTGILVFVGNCPVSHMSKRQGAIATSTYSAELCAAKQGCEEAISIRYLLRSLGIQPSGKTLLLGDNMSSLISATKPGSPCKKKASSIAYHYVRECNAMGIVSIKKIHTDHNLSDVFTKALGKAKFLGMIRRIFHST
jgi:hypothetical protein